MREEQYATVWKIHFFATSCPLPRLDTWVVINWYYVFSEQAIQAEYTDHLDLCSDSHDHEVVGAIPIKAQTMLVPLKEC